MKGQTQHRKAGDSAQAALDLKKIELALGEQGEFAGRIDLFAEIGSTNTYLGSYENSEAVHGRVCVTDFQSAGRGRRGSEWVSAARKNLTLSIAWNFDADVRRLNGLSLAVGVMLAGCLDENGVARLALKWPNDLYLDGRKVGGILIETASARPGLVRAVIGVGLNVGMSSTDADAIGQPWASLPLTDAGVDRNRLAALVINALRKGLAEFAETGFPAFANAWRKLNAHAGARVTIEQGGERLTGVVEDIDAAGALLLCLDSGERKRIMSGEISTEDNDLAIGSRLRLAEAK